MKLPLVTLVVGSAITGAFCLYVTFPERFVLPRLGSECRREFLASYAAMTRDDLFARSVLAVRGTVRSAVPHFEAPMQPGECREIYTAVTLSVDDLLFDRLSAKPTKVTFAMYGGEIDGEVLRNGNEPPFVVGQENVIFLSEPEPQFSHGAAYVYVPQGRYPVNADGTVGGSGDVSAFLRDIWGSENIAVSEFLRMIRASAPK